MSKALFRKVTVNSKVSLTELQKFYAEMGDSGRSIKISGTIHQSGFNDRTVKGKLQLGWPAHVLLIPSLQ